MRFDGHCGACGTNRQWGDYCRDGTITRTCADVRAAHQWRESMRTLRLIAAATLSIASSFTIPSFAAPVITPDSGQGLVTQVSGCHRNVRRHYVPEFGRTVPHVHQGPRCRPERAYAVEPPRRDCHRDARRHFVPGYGRVLHRHRRDCSVRILRRSSEYRGDNCVRMGPVVYCER